MLGGEVRAGRREGLWVVARRKCGYVHGEGPSQGLGARACAERTSNMLTMSVTVDVSQLSGWLKARASCQPKARGMRCGTRCGPGGGRAWGGGGASGVHGEGPTQGLGARARVERTENMWYKVVTLEVSKLSGWLKACAPCRVRREEHAMRCELCAVRREGVGRRRRKRRARGRADSRLGGQGTRGAHLEHAVHGRDLGGVNAQRLVEGVRFLPSRREGHAMRGEVCARRREGVGQWRRKRRARGKGLTPKAWGSRARAGRT